MLSLIQSWFGSAKKPPVSDALPEEVKTAISATSVIDRGSNGADLNLIVMGCGHGGFRFSTEAARTWLQTSFPELTEEQIARGLRYLVSHVKERQQRQARDYLEAHREPSAWSAWKPLRHSER